MQKKQGKKSMLELLRSGRVQVQMKTGEKVIRPNRGKGSYSRKLKHKKSEENRE